VRRLSACEPDGRDQAGCPVWFLSTFLRACGADRAVRAVGQGTGTYAAEVDEIGELEAAALAVEKALERLRREPDLATRRKLAEVVGPAVGRLDAAFAATRAHMDEPERLVVLSSIERLAARSHNSRPCVGGNCPKGGRLWHHAWWRPHALGRRWECGRSGEPAKQYLDYPRSGSYDQREGGNDTARWNGKKLKDRREPYDCESNRPGMNRWRARSRLPQTPPRRRRTSRRPCGPVSTDCA